MQIVYKRYASLFFAFAVSKEDNELMALEIIHRFVEVLDMYFGSVCELDIIFNFEKAYYILDELIIAGEVQDTSKKAVLKQIEIADTCQEEERMGLPIQDVGLIWRVIIYTKLIFELQYYLLLVIFIPNCLRAKWILRRPEKKK